VNAEQPDREEMAKAYEAVHNGIFLVRLIIVIVLLAGYLFTGASADLASGLASRFGDRWWWTNAAYLFVTLFGFSALMFPLNLYSDYLLEHRFGMSNQTINQWFIDHLKGLLIQLPLMTLFVSIIYAMLRWAPGSWWLWSTCLYAALSIFLAAFWSVWIMPLFYRFEPLAPGPLPDAVRAFAEKAGIDVLGVYRWGLEEKTDAANAALTGLGRTRRIILSDTMLGKFEQDEIIAVLAHEIGHFKHGDIWRLIISGTLLAGAGFWVAQQTLQLSSKLFGFAMPADIGTFPLMVFALFVFSLISMPLTNVHSRRREYAADAYAIHATGSAGPLRSALTKLADQNLADQEPAPWIEFLLHSHPSIKRRIAHAERVEMSAHSS
jgi:STE24 endopeptidase